MLLIHGDGNSTEGSLSMNGTAVRATINFLVVTLLCLGVVLQILGVPISFWDFTDADDLFTASVATGFAILSPAFSASPLSQYLVGFGIRVLSYRHLSESMLFHPPLV